MSHMLVAHILSDATFASGEGVPGIVDVEIEHDPAGLPIIRGRTLKGLLREECANLRYVLGSDWATWESAETFLFGRSGATLQDSAMMQVGTAQLPDAVRTALQGIPAHEVLEALTTIRRQTSIDAARGAPEKGSLRTLRVLLRQTYLLAEIDFIAEPDERALALLAGCVLSVRRGGTGRNRGRGALKLILQAELPPDPCDSTYMHTQFQQLAKLLPRAQEKPHASS